MCQNLVSISFKYLLNNICLLFENRPKFPMITKMKCIIYFRCYLAFHFTRFLKTCTFFEGICYVPHQTHLLGFFVSIHFFETFSFFFWRIHITHRDFSQRQECKCPGLFPLFRERHKRPFVTKAV